MGKMYVLSEKEQVVYVIRALNYYVDLKGNVEKVELFNKQVETLEESFKIAYETLEMSKEMKSHPFSHTITINECTISIDAINVECIATLGFQPTRKNINKLIKETMLSRIPTID